MESSDDVLVWSLHRLAKKLAVKGNRCAAREEAARENVVEFAAMPYFSAGKVSAPVLRLLSLGMALLCLPHSSFIWIWRAAKTLMIGGRPELQLWV